MQETKGERSQILGIDHHLHDNDLQQFVNTKTQRPLTFSYSALEFEGKQIGLIHIPLQNRPLYLTKDFGKLTRNTVYIRRGSATAIATPDEIATMGIEESGAKTVREPVLSVSFHSAGQEKHHLKVKAVESLEKNVILDQLTSIKIDGKELKRLQRHAETLNGMPDRYPDGQIYYPYKVDKVFTFIKQLNKSIELVQNDFASYKKQANIFKRSVPLYKPPWANVDQSKNDKLPRYVITEVYNNGTSPAQNVIIYIRSNEQLRFYNFEDLKEKNITPYDKIPDDIQKIFTMARKLDGGEITTGHYSGLASQVGIGLGAYNYSSLFSSHIPKSTLRVIESNLQIKLASMLMHNHKESITDSDIYLCPFLEKGQAVTLEYECHSSDLPVPQKGFLTFTAE